MVIWSFFIQMQQQLMILFLIYNAFIMDEFCWATYSSNQYTSATYYKKVIKTNNTNNSCKEDILAIY